jgi:hypothetical protein
MKSKPRAISARLNHPGQIVLETVTLTRMFAGKNGNHFKNPSVDLKDLQNLIKQASST